MATKKHVLRPGETNEIADIVPYHTDDEPGRQFLLQ